MATKTSRGQAASVAFIIDGSDLRWRAARCRQPRCWGKHNRSSYKSKSYLGKPWAGCRTTAVDVRSQVWYNPDMVSAYFMVPGMIGMILQTMTTLLTAVAIVRERERGTIEQLIVTPIRSWELLVGKTGALRGDCVR